MMRAVLSLAILTAALTAGFAQETPPVDQETILTVVHDFLQTFYPEAFTKGVQLNLCVSHPAEASWRRISGVYFRATRGTPVDPNNVDAHGPMESGGSENPRGTPTLVGGWFWFRPQGHGRIQQMVASFDLVHEKQLKDLRQLVESHSEWSEDQAIRALKQAGARYGPAEKELFVDSLHLERAEKFLGRLKIELVEFETLSLEHVGNFAQLLWIVQAVAEFPDGTHETYGFTFEPFEGKLTGVSHIMDKNYPAHKQPQTRP